MKARSYELERTQLADHDGPNRDVVVTTERIGNNRFVTKAWQAAKGPLPQFTLHATGEDEARENHHTTCKKIKLMQRRASGRHDEAGVVNG